MGTSDGMSVGTSVGAFDGTSDGMSVGMSVGASVGKSVGVSDGTSDGLSVGLSVGETVGEWVGDSESQNAYVAGHSRVSDINPVHTPPEFTQYPVPTEHSVQNAIPSVKSQLRNPFGQVLIRYPKM